MNSDSSNVKAIEELAIRASGMFNLGNGKSGVIIPDGCHLKTWDDRNSIHERVTMTDVDSFIQYVSDFRLDSTRIFAERMSAGSHLDGRYTDVLAVIDWHEKRLVMPADHACRLIMRLSDEFLEWEAACGDPISQKDFANFIEEHDVDIIQPESAKLLDIVMNFRRVSSVRYGSSIRLDNGDYSIEYSENSGVKGSVKVPSKIIIGIPVFRGADETWRIEVNLRHRVNDGKLSFSMEMRRKNSIIEGAEEDEFERIRNGLKGIPFHIGSVARF